MEDRQRLIKMLAELLKDTAYTDIVDLKPEDVRVILDLLKDQEEEKRKLLQVIADNQLANSPNGNETEFELKYKTGIWNGLQIAYELIENSAI